jgi:hypothetical protein
VIVYDLSRLSREDLLGTAEVWSALEDAGADLIDATSGGKVRRLEYVVRAELNRQQWEAARERGNDARRRAIARGAYVSAKVPLGYVKVNQGLVPDPEVAPIVVELFERRARGESWSALARWMRSVGHSASRSGLKAVVGNEAYLGVARSGAFRNEEAHAPVIGRALFDRANAAKGLRPVRTGALSSVAMLRSLCRCASCGGTMSVTWTRGATDSTSGRRAKIPAYACRGDSARGSCEGRAYARVDELDALVEARIIASFGGTGPLAEAVAATEALEDAARRVDEADHALRSLLENPRLVTVLGPDEYVGLIEGAKREQGFARLEYADARNRSDGLEGFNGDMLGAWPGLSPHEKREILGGFVDRVVVAPSRGRRVALGNRVQIVLTGNVLLGTDDDLRVPRAEECEPRGLSGGSDVGG